MSLWLAACSRNALAFLPRAVAPPHLGRRQLPSRPRGAAALRSVDTPWGSEWVRYEDKAGVPYWLNPSTMDTTRDDPALAAAPPPDADADVADGGGDGCRLLTAEELEVELADDSSPLLVDAFAEWCGPCLMMSPVLDRVAAALGARARVRKFDTDEPGATLADRLQIGGLPTLLLFAPSSNHGGGGALQARTHAVAAGIVRARVVIACFCARFVQRRRPLSAWCRFERSAAERGFWCGPPASRCACLSSTAGDVTTRLSHVYSRAE